MILVFKYMMISLAFSQGFDPEVINVLSTANQQKLNDIEYRCNQEIRKSYQVTYKDYNNCAIALCGLPNKNKSTYVSDENILNFVKDETKDKINSLNKVFEELYAIGLKKSEMELEDIIKTFDPEKIKNLNPEKLSDNDFRTIGDSLFEKYTSKVVDKTKPYPYRVTYNLVNVPKDSSSQFLLALNDFKEINSQYLNNKGWEGDALYLYSQEELSNLLLSKFKKIENSIKQSPEVIQDSELVELKGKLEDIKKNFSKDLNIKDAGELLSQLEKIFPEGPNKPICKTQNCFNYITQYIKEQDPAKYAKILLEKIKDPEEKRTNLNRCKASIMYGSINILNSSEKSKKIFTDAKNAIKKEILKKFSEDSRTTLAAFMDNDLTIAEGKQNEEFNTASFVEAVESEKVISKTHRYSTVMSNEKALNLKDNIDATNALVFGETICGKIDGTNLIIEQFIPKEKEKHLINVSHYSCEHQVFGKQILSHELAHALGFAFQNLKMSESSSKLYKELRECVASIHKNDNRLNLNYKHSEKETFYTEEDVADVIAFKSNLEEKELFMCNALQPSLDSKTYINLNPLGLSEDAHSTALVRVLHESLYKNITLPLSCKKILDNDTSLELKKCL